MWINKIPHWGTNFLNRDEKRRNWSRRWDSNPRPLLYESIALPLSYIGLLSLNQSIAPRPPAFHSVRQEWPGPPAWPLGLGGGYH